MRIAVQGIGLVSGFKDYESGMNFLYAQDDFSPGNSCEIIQGKYQNKFVSRSDTSELASFLPKRKLRRIDHYSRMALLGAGKALKDAGPAKCAKDRTGVIVATGFGALKTTFAFLDSYIEKGDKLAFPTHFSNSVHNAAAAHISILYKITGPTLTVSQFDISFFSALFTASVWLEQEDADAVLVGCSDEFCDVMGYCIHGFFDKKTKNDVYMAGEGASFFLLTREEKDHEPAYGYIDDVSFGNFKKNKINIPDKSLVILSPGTMNACNHDFIKDFINDLIKKTDSTILIHNNAKFPTDIGFDAACAIGRNKNNKICFIKAEDNGEYGTILFNT